MKNLYVGNLPHSTTEAELRNVFEAYGGHGRFRGARVGLALAIVGSFAAPSPFNVTQ